MADNTGQQLTYSLTRTLSPNTDDGLGRMVRTGLITRGERVLVSISYFSTPVFSLL